jgi:hypothetical protein
MVNASISARPPSRGKSLVLWCIAAGLLANAAAIFWAHRGNGGIPEFISGNALYGRTPRRAMLGANGIYMMPGQIGAHQWGVFLMDLDSDTLCVYETLPASSRLRLMAARDFKYDRYLTDLNNESPTPHQVKILVRKQRQREAAAKPLLAPKPH